MKLPEGTEVFEVIDFSINKRGENPLLDKIHEFIRREKKKVVKKKKATIIFEEN